MKFIEFHPCLEKSTNTKSFLSLQDIVSEWMRFNYLTFNNYNSDFDFQLLTFKVVFVDQKWWIYIRQILPEEEAAA